jgi:hypothetical protein
MNNTLKVILLFSGLIAWITLVVISYKNNDIFTSTAAGILLGATASEIFRNYGQIRERSKL